MEVSGLLISCATPAAICPTVASFSAWMTWFCSTRKPVTSWPTASTAEGRPPSARTLATLKAARASVPLTDGSRTSQLDKSPPAATCFMIWANSGIPASESHRSNSRPTTVSRGKPVSLAMARFHTITRPARSVAMTSTLAWSTICSR